MSSRIKVIFAQAKLDSYVVVSIEVDEEKQSKTVTFFCDAYSVIP